MDKLNRYNEAIERLQKRLNKEPNLIQIADELNISLKDVSEIENYINYISVISLEDLIFSSEDEVPPLIGTIKDDKSPSPEKHVEEEEQLDYLAKSIELLNEKDRLVITLYYYEELTLKEIGKILNVSESRVCQLHSRAIVHLKKAMVKLKYN